MLNRLGDMPLAVPPGESVSQDGNQNFQSPDSSVSEEMRSALMKKVALEKRRTSSHKKVDLKRVSDPKGIQFLSYVIQPPRHALDHVAYSAFFFREKGQRVVVSLPGLHY